MSRKPDLPWQIAFGFFLTLFACIFLTGANPLADQTSEVRNWPSTNGKVESVRIKEVVRDSVGDSASRQSTHYQVVVSYKYEVDGQMYESSRYGLVVPEFAYRAEAARLASRYSEGSSQRVFYDSADPSEAYLNRDSTDTLFIGYTLALFCFLGSFVFFAWGRSWQAGLAVNLIAFMLVSAVGSCNLSQVFPGSQRTPDPDVQTDPLTDLQREAWTQMQRGDPFSDVGAHLGSPTGSSENGDLITYYYEASRGGFVDTRLNAEGVRVVTTFQAPFESEAEIAERDARRQARAEKAMEEAPPLIEWRDSFKKITPGMDGVEVERILGKPSFGQKSNDRDPQWTYALKSPNARTVIHFKGKRMADPAELKVTRVDICELTPHLMKYVDHSLPIHKDKSY